MSCKRLSRRCLTCLCTWGELEKLEELDPQAGLCFMSSIEPLHRHLSLRSFFGSFERCFRAERRIGQFRLMRCMHLHGGIVGLLPGSIAVHLFLDPPIEDLWPHLRKCQDDIFEPLDSPRYIIDDWWS